MVTIRINKQKFKFAQNFSEVDADKLMACENFIDELVACSDVPREIFLNVPVKNLFPLYTIISFLDDNEDIDNALIGVSGVANIELESYMKLEQCRQILRSGKPYKQLMRIAKVYHPDIKETVLLLSYGANILNQIAVFLENYKEMNNAELSEDEQNAGFERLSVFGGWGTAFSMSGEDPIKTKAILQEPAIDIYTALFYSYIKSTCQKELFKAKNKT